MNKKELNQILIDIDKRCQELEEKSGLDAANNFLADFLKSHQPFKDITVEKLVRCHFLDFWESWLGCFSNEATEKQKVLFFNHFDFLNPRDKQLVESYKQVYSAVFAGADYLKEYEDKIAARRMT